ncbi:MAG: FtsQ-type POTRA domain-containing protein [Treponema sp.]|jgi:cell division protein FtsQ|nr:FtsQ-type POTRA domain-containing protein [Treponema sp.]
MSGDFSYAADFHAETKTSKKAGKGLKRLFIFSGVVLVAELVWLFGVSPFFPFATVEIHGFSGFDRAEILSCANIDDNSSFISTNIGDVQKRLSENCLVESARVTKHFPDKLSIFLVPRKAVAVSLVFDGMRHLPVYIDRQGVIFKIGEDVNGNTPEIKTGLPVISGLEIGLPELGMRLPDALIPLPESISKIAFDSPELLAAVSEIRVERKSWEGFDLVLFPVHGAIRVRVDNNLTEDVIRYMMLILDVFESRFPKPEEIDFRSGLGSYKMKESSLW